MVINITEIQRHALHKVDNNVINVGKHKQFFHTRTLNCLLRKKLIEINNGVYIKTEFGRIVLCYNHNNIDLDLTWLKQAYSERG